MRSPALGQIGDPAGLGDRGWCCPHRARIGRAAAPTWEPGRASKRRGCQLATWFERCCAGGSLRNRSDGCHWPEKGYPSRPKPTLCRL